MLAIPWVEFESLNSLVYRAILSGKYYWSLPVGSLNVTHVADGHNARRNSDGN